MPGGLTIRSTCLTQVGKFANIASISASISSLMRFSSSVSSKVGKSVGSLEISNPLFSLDYDKRRKVRSVLNCKLGRLESNIPGP